MGVGVLFRVFLAEDVSVIFFFSFFSSLIMLCGWKCLLIEGLPAAINTGMEDFPRLTDEEKKYRKAT